LTLHHLQDELAQALSDLSLGGPFITQKGFWEDEGGGDNPAMSAPLLDRNNGSLSSTTDGNDDILKRTAGWAALCGADKVDKARDLSHMHRDMSPLVIFKYLQCLVNMQLPPVTALKGAGTTQSIIWRDAERT
jgi:hypothetical protein